MLFKTQKIDFDYGFSKFLQYVPKLIDIKLPAFDAHVKMAPLERLDSLRSSNISDKPRTAAVMMLFYPKNEITHLVLIVKFL
jgi:hypothetical protein